MYKIQSAFTDSTVQAPSVDMKTLKQGRVIWNLTKSTISYQTPNAAVKFQPAAYLSNKHIEPVSTAPKQKLLSYHVIPLNETLDRFLKTVHPLLTPAEFKEQVQITKEFAKKDGQELQCLLEECGKKEKNWLAHRWLKAAYLQYRDPVTVYVSPAMTFPMQTFKDEKAYIDYTAKVIYGLGDFKNIVDAGKIPIVKMGLNELDNSQFGKVFGTCRIPCRSMDELVYNPKSKHIVVLYKNYFYKMDLFNEQGKLWSAKILTKQLTDIIKAESASPVGPAYGLLTTDTRDNWAEAYEIMAKTSSNCDAFKIIQSALFTVSLDQCVTPNPGEETNQLALQLIHGGGSKVNGGNRWMDKTIQLVVNPNGMSGFTYEHSPAEGQPIAMMMDYVVKKMLEDKKFGEQGETENSKAVQKLAFSTPDRCVEDLLYTAAINIDKLTHNLQMQVLKFNSYGKDFIKKQRLGPDSYVQMALQLAFFKMHQVPAAQYESAHLRIFENGRTETIRSCSTESLAFCQAMADKTCSDQQRADLLRKAVSGHQNYTKLALQGRGVDRHLLGLKLMALENGLPVPKFYSSKGYVKSMHFRMSTSQVATLYDAFMGYGPATDDGYACCYNPRECDIILAISCWRHNQETDHLKFAKTLEESFLQMQKTLSNCPAPEATAKSKL